ncbi:MAG: GNAT family N-acetyltransferase [Fibrobacterota bacterium]
MEINIRPATMADRDLLFAWVNDPETRANSFNPSPVKYEQHCAWFSKKLQQKEDFLLIAENGENKPVGQMRLDKTKDGGTVSISVCPESRGKGVGLQMLTALDASVQANRLPYRKILAEIKLENSRSLKMFERAGYSLVETLSDRYRMEKILI